ncbi:MAG: DUF4265 domain-containing protein [Acidobacteriota bacterium]|nr:MAG: DUF4265 domain-containing protein [Acidobacteriota bacterium]
MSDSIAQHAAPEEKLEKIFFYLPTDDDGYPPYSYESLWAEKIRDDTYRIENIPFFVRELCVDDIVAVSDEDGSLYFQEVLEYSRHNTVRVVVIEEERTTHLISGFRKLGLAFEGLDNYLFAIDIDDPEKMAQLANFLADGEEKGWWEYEESALRL